MASLQYLLHNTSSYIPYTAGLNAIYAGKFRMFQDIDYINKSVGNTIGTDIKVYPIGEVDDGQDNIYHLLCSWSIDIYAYRALFSLRPTFIYSDVMNIDDTSLELSVNFYNEDNIIVTKTYQYTLNKQKINTIHCIDSMPINSKITKFTVTSKSKINTTVIPLSISVANHQSYGEIILYC